MELQRNAKLPVGVQKIWAILRRFDSGELQDVFGTLVSVESKEGQLVRTFANINRSRTVQVLGAVDESAMTVEIETIQTPFPVSSMHAKWWVEGTDEASVLGVLVTCIPDGANEEQLTAMFDDAWNIGISAFKKKLLRRS